MTNHTWDAIVIGGGAAGLSAAQALGRSLRRTLVIDAGSPRNRFASHMHNVLGHDGTPPGELLARGREEAAGYGVEFRDGSVAAVRDGETGEGSPRTVLVQLEAAGPGAAPETLETRALIVATGVRDELPEIPGLAEHWGSSVLHCPYCHGWEVRGQRLAVITTSPLGLHQARLIRQWSDRLTVFAAGLGAVAPETAREFAARGVELVPEPVAAVVGDGTRVSAVRTADGRERPVDAIFTMGAMRPHDAFLSGLGLDRAESPMGSFIAVDATGLTSHPRIWAAGNVVNPGAPVPVVSGAAVLAGATANAALIEEDFALAAAHGADPAGSVFADTDPDAPEGSGAAEGPDAADTGGAAGAERASSHDHSHDDGPEDPLAFWEQRYSGADAVWSGRVNRSLADAAADWRPGRALDLGCGEGGDVLWLAERGWDATGIDLSETAIGRAREAAAARGIAARLVAADLGAWAERPAAIDGAAEPFDLVTASFFQSPVELPRERILRAAAARVAPGGRLVVVSHAAPPPWSEGHCGPFPSPESELELLDLDPALWTVEAAEVRRREVIAPDGSRAELDDTVVIARRRSLA